MQPRLSRSVCGDGSTHRRRGGKHPPGARPAGETALEDFRPAHGADGRRCGLIPAMASPETVDVAIIGGGAAGTFTAVHLLRTGRPVRVAIVERADRLGRGDGFRPAEPTPPLK